MVQLSSAVKALCLLRSGVLLGGIDEDGQHCNGKDDADGVSNGGIVSHQLAVCIGVDPYYLAQCAQRHGYNPEIILAGRRMNDGMGEYVATETIKLMLKKGIQVLNSNIIILGFTFKENCPDVRNTKVIDIYKALKEYNLNITVYDPWANPAIVEHEYGIKVVNELPSEKFDAAIAAVAHKKFEGLDVPALLKDNHVIFDVKCTLDRSIVDGRL